MSDRAMNVSVPEVALSHRDLLHLFIELLSLGEEKTHVIGYEAT